jgi:hypothetical protein
MADYTDIAPDIKTKLLEIPNIGLVYTYQRQAVDMSKFINLFARDIGGGKKEIRGWEITRQAIAEHKRGAFFGHHVMIVRGYMGISDADASSETFQALVDLIRAKFRTAEPDDSAADWDYRDGDNITNSPVQVPLLDDRMFGSVLCHHAEIHISVTDRIVQ